MISLDKTICRDLEAALSREWLETNGLGGFACGTVAGANTRRYHGLLTAALNPPGGRILLLSKMEETLMLGDRRIDLSTNEYRRRNSFARIFVSLQFSARSVSGIHV